MVPKGLWRSYIHPMVSLCALPRVEPLPRAMPIRISAGFDIDGFVFLPAVHSPADRSPKKLRILRPVLQINSSCFRKSQNSIQSPKIVQMTESNLSSKQFILKFLVMVHLFEIKIQKLFDADGITGRQSGIAPTIRARRKKCGTNVDQSLFQSHSRLWIVF